MKIKKTMKVFGLATIMSMSLYACSTEESQYSPEQVIQNALKDTEKTSSYYAESVMTSTDDTGNMLMKEWYNEDGKRRTETVISDTQEKSVAVNDGKQITLYEEASNSATVIAITEEVAAMGQMSPKEQAEQLLKVVKDTHTITLISEEKIAGRDTYHLKAKVNDNNSLYGDHEIWVDKQNWFVLKTVSKSDDFQFEIEYTKIEFDAKIDDNLFVLDLPADVEIEDIADNIEENIISSLDEATQIMEKPFLYVRENDTLKINQISTMSFKKEQTNPELTLTYSKDNAPYFSLSAFAIDEKDKEAVDDEGVAIRGLQGAKMDIENFRLLNWAENGYGYSVILLDPSLTFEEMLALIEDMEYVQ